MPAAFCDPELYNKTKQIISQYSIDTAYETGSFHGESAIILSGLVPKVISYELNSDSYNTALHFTKRAKNIVIKHKSSPEGLMEDLIENKNNVLLFLDAHWYDYWPILDELNVIAVKKIKPVILIHDFFVPDKNNNAKFGYDSYKGQPLNYEYIKQGLINIYGSENNYKFEYSKDAILDSGLIYIYPH